MLVEVDEIVPYNDGAMLVGNLESRAAQPDAYVHVSIHIAEDIENANLDSLDSGPHAHIGGWIATKNKVWKRHAEDPTNVSLKSVSIPVTELRPFAQLIELADKKA